MRMYVDKFGLILRFYVCIPFQDLKDLPDHQAITAPLVGTERPVTRAHLAPAVPQARTVAPALTVYRARMEQTDTLAPRDLQGLRARMAKTGRLDQLVYPDPRDRLELPVRGEDSAKRDLRVPLDQAVSQDPRARTAQMDRRVLPVRPAWTGHRVVLDQWELPVYLVRRERQVRRAPEVCPVQKETRAARKRLQTTEPLSPPTVSRPCPLMAAVVATRLTSTVSQQPSVNNSSSLR